MPFQLPRTTIGQRRTRICFQRFEESTSGDGMGGQIASGNGWITVAHAWGHVTALDERGREALSALQIQGKAAYHVDIAHRTGLDPVPAKWRMSWNGKVREIQSAVDDVGDKRRLVILATETE